MKQSILGRNKSNEEGILALSSFIGLILVALLIAAVAT